MAWEKFTAEVLKDHMYTDKADFKRFPQLFFYFVL